MYYLLQLRFYLAYHHNLKTGLKFEVYFWLKLKVFPVGVDNIK